MRRRLWLGAALAAIGVAGSAAAHTAFTRAAHRNPPLLIDHHGTARKPLRIITFVPSTYPSAAVLRDFGNAIAKSTWLADVARAYGVPATATASGYLVTDMPKLKSNSTAATYQTYLAKKLAALGIGAAPKKQTIVILYIPCASPQALDTFGCVSHHPALKATTGQPFTALDSMAVVTGSPGSSTDSKTITASHELAEAVTDTGNGWYLHAANPDKPWLDSSPFVEEEGSGNTEAADLSSGSRWLEPRGSTTYAYQRIYANRRSKLGGDPAVPSSPHPYYDVSAAKDWYKVAAGGMRTVTLTGWSAKKVPAWTVAADIVSWEGSKAGTAPDPCTIVGKTSWSVANGATLPLKVKAKSGSKGKWCDVRLKSSAVSPPADGDSFHPWYVGFQIS